MVNVLRAIHTESHSTQCPVYWTMGGTSFAGQYIEKALIMLGMVKAVVVLAK